MSEQRLEGGQVSDLSPQEIRHLLNYLEIYTGGRYDIESGKWTYPNEIRRKLEWMLKRQKQKGGK